MAQANFTPVSLYYSTNVAAVPSAANLTYGELAINIVSGTLYFKDSNNTVQVIASKTAANGVSSISFGSTGLTPSTASNGAVTVAGTVTIASGGTGQNTASAAFNALSPITTTGDLILGNGTNSSTRLGIGANGTVLTSNGTTATWQTAASGGISTGKSIAMALIFGF
jgi:hypothetical protein